MWGNIISTLHPPEEKWRDSKRLPKVDKSSEEKRVKIVGTAKKRRCKRIELLDCSWTAQGNTKGFSGSDREIPHTTQR